MNDFNLMTTGFGFDNFNPEEIQSDEVILVTIACDISPSMEPREAELNAAFTGFLSEMQGSHVASKLMVKTIEFNEKVTHKTGFQPITSLDVNHFSFKPSGSSTALADAAFEAVEETLKYRKSLEDTGVNVKALVFVITDGEENSSRRALNSVDSLIKDVLKEERNVFSFETILFGIGQQSSYETAQKQMGFKHLAVVGNTAKEVRKLIGFISASISKSSSNQTVTF